MPLIYDCQRQGNMWFPQAWDIKLKGNRHGVGTPVPTQAFTYIEVSASV